MELAAAEYLEVNSIGIMLLLTLLFYTCRRHYVGNREDKVHFIRMMVFNILILFSDSGILCLKDHPAAGLILLNHCFCIAFFVLHSWFSYEWVLYVIARLYPRYRPEKKKFLLLAPTLISSLAAVSSPWTQWVYRISAENVYHRGNLMWISSAAAFVYLTVSTVIILHEWLHSTRSRKTSEYLTLLIFPLALMAGNLLQIVLYGLSIVWVLSALLFIMLFIDLQNDQLAMDRMTGIYNRGYAGDQLRWEAKHRRPSSGLLFVALFDLDHFKKINDRYGHLSGDRALQQAARILEENSRKNDSACRYGGDEFLLTGHVKEEEDVRKILQRIRDAAEEVSLTEKYPFRISMSCGYAIRRPEDDINVDEVLNEADRNMYKEKRLKNCGQE